uniref:Uncharacterized protein n=1 Tax=Panagrolaimus davidi TaxID=227884 RepID=A0A914PQ03_9BILA
MRILFLLNFALLVYAKKYDCFSNNLTVYEWAENQAIVKNESNDENLNTNDAIKAEMTPFFKLMKFKKMKPRFLNEYVVKITSINGQSLFCIIDVLNNFDTIKIIKSLKNVPSDNRIFEFIYWKTKCKKPSTPCPLKWRAGVEWYLIYFDDGDIGLRRGSEFDEQQYYLIAEMTAETHFVSTHECKIEIE